MIRQMIGIHAKKLRLLFVTTGIKSNKTWLTGGSDYDLVLELLLTFRSGFMSKGNLMECKDAFSDAF